MLNFYDTEAVKAFTLKTLIENRELTESLEYERAGSNDWFHRFQSEEKKVKELEAKAAAAIAELTHYQDAREFGVVSSPDADEIVKSVISILKGGSDNE